MPDPTPTVAEVKSALFGIGDHLDQIGCEECAKRMGTVRRALAERAGYAQFHREVGYFDAREFMDSFTKCTAEEIVREAYDFGRREVLAEQTLAVAPGPSPDNLHLSEGSRLVCEAEHEERAQPRAVFSEVLLDELRKWRDGDAPTPDLETVREMARAILDATGGERD